MNDFMAWCISNIGLLVNIFLCIVSLIVLLLKKPFKVNSNIVASCLEKLPVWICEAEKTGLKDKEKLNYVVNQACIFLAKANGLSFEDSKLIFTDILVKDIEQILLTPTKKGD